MEILIEGSPSYRNTSKEYIDDYYDYEEEESYDNCSLASSLYYPLRRSETHYKRYKYNNTILARLC